MRLPEAIEKKTACVNVQNDDDLDYTQPIKIHNAYRIIVNTLMNLIPAC